MIIIIIISNLFEYYFLYQLIHCLIYKISGKCLPQFLKSKSLNSPKPKDINLI